MALAIRWDAQVLLPSWFGLLVGTCFESRLVRDTSTSIDSQMKLRLSGKPFKINGGEECLEPLYAKGLQKAIEIPPPTALSAFETTPAPVTPDEVFPDTERGQQELANRKAGFFQFEIFNGPCGCQL